MRRNTFSNYNVLFIYSESWHNQLKQVYLTRKRIHRLDVLLNVLSEDVAFDIIREVKRLSINVGRMGVYEHQLRKEEIKINTIKKSLWSSMVYQLSGTEYTCCSFVAGCTNVYNVIITLYLTFQIVSLHTFYYYPVTYIFVYHR